MMNCQQYQDLDELSQVQLLWKDGVYLMMRNTENVNVALYKLYGYFVEVYFDREINEPLYFKSFEGMDGLENYFELIPVYWDISGIQFPGSKFPI